MNTTTIQTNGSGLPAGQAGGGNWIAFVFGAIFNLLANVNLSFLLDYILQAIVVVLPADIFSPLWLKHRDKIKSMTKLVKRVAVGWGGVIGLWIARSLALLRKNEKKRPIQVALLFGRPEVAISNP